MECGSLPADMKLICVNDASKQQLSSTLTIFAKKKLVSMSKKMMESKYLVNKIVTFIITRSKYFNCCDSHIFCSLLKPPMKWHP